MTTYHDILAQQIEKDTFRLKCIFNPTHIMSITLPESLNWKNIKFEAGNKKKVSKKRGLYSFIIGHPDSNLPLHGYIAYIGETGELRRRFGDYLREQNKPKRHHINFMLNTWKDCIYFHYAEIDNATASLKQIEELLNNAILPPFLVDDLSADVKKSKKLWSLR